MVTSDMDYLLDDTTGDIMNADFCDVHDRRFLRVRTTQVREHSVAVQVYDLGKIAPSAFAGVEYHQLSRALLIFPGRYGAASPTSTIKYNAWEEAMPVEQYLHKSIISRFVPFLDFLNVLIVPRQVPQPDV